MGVSFRSKKSFGERIEHWIMGEMLKEGMDVYLSTVDDRGVDMVVRNENGIFIEVQIKARSEDAKKDMLFNTKPFIARKNYFFIFYAEGRNIKWIFSSKELDAEAETNKTGKNKGERSIILVERFDKYIATNFDRLKEYKGG